MVILLGLLGICIFQIVGLLFSLLALALYGVKIIECLTAYAAKPTLANQTALGFALWGDGCW